MRLYLQSLVLALCRLLLRGGVYGLFILCKLRPQRRLFLFSLAGQFFDMLLIVPTIESVSAILFVPKNATQGGGPLGWSSNGYLYSLAAVLRNFAYSSPSLAILFAVFFASSETILYFFET